MFTCWLIKKIEQSEEWPEESQKNHLKLTIYACHGQTGNSLQFEQGFQESDTLNKKKK